MRILADRDRAGRRDGLHPRSQIGGVPDRRVLNLTRAGRDRAHDDLTGVDADARLDRHSSISDDLRRVAFQFLLHPQRRIERALRMVLVRDRRAEHREDAVAGGLHHVAVVAAHRIDHQLERWIDDRARFFGIEVLLQLRRTLEGALRGMIRPIRELEGEVRTARYRPIAA